jgi:hypothetical protein
MNQGNMSGRSRKTNAVVNRSLLSEVVLCERIEVRAACLDFNLVLWKDTAV